MKKLKVYMLSLTLLLSATVINAQTADEVIAKHIAAIGGKDKIAQIISINVESTIEVMGSSNYNKVNILNGKGYKSEFDFGGTKIIQCFTDKGGWFLNPLMGISSPTAMPNDDYNAGKDDMFVGGPLLDYAAKGNTVELKGIEKLGSRDAFKIIVTSPQNVVNTEFIDTVTYYIIKAVRNTNGQETSAVYSNFKTTDFGYTMAYTAEVTLPQGLTIISTVSKVEFNPSTDASAFDMPK